MEGMGNYGRLISCRALFAVHMYICTRIQVGDHGLESIIIVSVNDCIVRAFGGAVGPEGLVMNGYMYIQYLFTCMSDQ